MRLILLILTAILGTVCTVPASGIAQAATPDATSAPGAHPSDGAGRGPAAATAQDMVLGKADAPVTIIEYASLTCPHCADFETKTLPEVKKNWIETGKAKLVFRAFPFDQIALKAAILARCSGPERFFNYLDVLYSSQESWVRANDPVAALGRIAKLGGMSESQFQACLNNSQISDQVVGERLAGEKEYGVDSTPTFFINGKKLVGAMPYADFEQALKAASTP